jgi:hypothetical protein
LDSGYAAQPVIMIVTIGIPDGDYMLARPQYVASELIHPLSLSEQEKESNDIATVCLPSGKHVSSEYF